MNPARSARIPLVDLIYIEIGGHFPSLSKLSIFYLKSFPICSLSFTDSDRFHRAGVGCGWPESGACMFDFGGVKLKLQICLDLACFEIVDLDPQDQQLGGVFSKLHALYLY
ncbi:hypothetical protein DY000_02006246 [Brassica cretica]|uniref:FBD domain-containing protein n=1 Tax=Brassica cretica TaxID=69181 RepID=A0ABQ7CDY4_BRACR|nr:hypothetical protein DY000_02006246 [Brassica cretica]